MDCTPVRHGKSRIDLEGFERNVQERAFTGHGWDVKLGAPEIPVSHLGVPTSGRSYPWLQGDDPGYTSFNNGHTYLPWFNIQAKWQGILPCERPPMACTKQSCIRKETTNVEPSGLTHFFSPSLSLVALKNCPKHLRSGRSRI